MEPSLVGLFFGIGFVLAFLILQRIAVTLNKRSKIDQIFQNYVQKWDDLRAREDKLKYAEMLAQKSNDEIRIFRKAIKEHPNQENCGPYEDRMRAKERLIERLVSDLMNDVKSNVIIKTIPSHDTAERCNIYEASIRIASPITRGGERVDPIRYGNTASDGATGGIGGVANPLVAGRDEGASDPPYTYEGFVDAIRRWTVPNNLTRWGSMHRSGYARDVATSSANIARLQQEQILQEMGIGTRRSGQGSDVQRASHQPLTIVDESREFTPAISQAFEREFARNATSIAFGSDEPLPNIRSDDGERDSSSEHSAVGAERASEQDDQEVSAFRED